MWDQRLQTHNFFMVQYYYTVDPKLLPLYLEPMIPPKRFDIFPPDWGMLRRSTEDAFRFFFKNNPMSCEYCSMCVVFSSHLFWTSSSLHIPAGVTQEEHRRKVAQDFSYTFIFLARRIQRSFPSSTVKSNFVYHLLVFIFIYF